MLKSMTGYGKGEATAPHGAFMVEIRSVNHRYGEIAVRMPRSFLALESEVKKQIAAVLKRGKIDVSVMWEEACLGDSMPQVDLELARHYQHSFTHLADELKLSREINLNMIISQKGVIREVAVAREEGDVQQALTEAVQAAVSTLDAMRLREGEALETDLRARREQVAAWAAEIGQRTPLVIQEYRQKLKGRLDLLLEGNDIDETRLAQEVALLADRCDITEELVRLASHFSQFDEALAMTEPVGRKLDFLMQEMNREVNTIGSKSNDAGITSLVIRIKAEMEKMREQVQNVE